MGVLNYGIEKEKHIIVTGGVNESIWIQKSLLYRKAPENSSKEKYINIGRLLGLEDIDLIINSLKNKEVLSSYKDLFYSYPYFILFVKEKVVGQPYYLLIDEEWKFCGIYKINHYIECNKHHDFNGSVSDGISVISCDFHFQNQIDYDDGDIYCSYVQYK